MNRKAIKITNPPMNDDIELLKLEQGKNLLELEKSKFEYQKKVDEQRLSYEAKKAPPNLTRRLTIAAIVIGVLSPLVSAVVGVYSARLVFASKEVELRTQKTVNETDTRFKVTSFLLNNWRDLNNRPREEKQFFASLIADFLPEQQSIQLLDNLERTSLPATKDIWRAAKASIVNAQSLTADIALQTDEKATAPAQETNAPDVAKTLGLSRSTTPNWMLGSYGASWTGVINDPLSAFATDPNIVASTSLADSYPLSGLKTARLSSLIESGGLNDPYQIGASPYLTATGLLTSHKPSTLADSRIFIALAGEQTVSGDRALMIAGPESVSAITVTGVPGKNSATRPAIPYTVIDAGLGRTGIPGITPDSEIRKPFPIVKPGAEAMAGTTVTKAFYFDTNGRLTTEPPAKASVVGFPLTFSDAQNLNVLPVGVGATVKEKPPTVMVEASKARMP